MVGLLSWPSIRRSASVHTSEAETSIDTRGSSLVAFRNARRGPPDYGLKTSSR
jgi:hypothetical protein